ncbi:MAG: amino acid permease [Methylomarinum sp.]|nr:amino acid permease [Methylomarinum sp.]
MKASGRLGTFAGVFTPSILTILGIILFLRLGYIVGTAGLAQTLIILLLANSISVLSSLSLAAISTNLQVKAGGIYYLISRTLGHEFGGAIGIVLFLAQAISIGFYCLGFAEILTTALPETTNPGVQSLAAIAILVLFVLAWLGADWATRFQYVVMSILSLALVSFFWGAYHHWDPAIFSNNWSAVDNSVQFWVIFALFFPAVTGFTQGVNMSGDLQDPEFSLPLGTFSAIFLSIFVYLLAVVAYAGSITKMELIDIPNPMTQVALFEHAIIAGVVAATLSSALASFLGAPRILQSLANDRLWKILLPFAKGSGSNNNPRRGILLSAAIALLTVFIGHLNMIAPVVSMFFLISYGLINFATYFEATADSPSFRPTFHWFNKNLSLLGGLLCLGAMLAINIIAGIIALAILMAIYYYLRNTGMRSRWADGWRSFHLFRIREHLLAAYREPEHPRDWRPNILLFPIHYPGSQTLYRFAALLEAQSGFTTVIRIVLGTGAKLKGRKQQSELALQQELKDQNLQAFPLVLTASSIDISIHTLIQAYGIGPLRANTILLPWLAKDHGLNTQPGHSYTHHLRVALRLQCNLLILAEPQPKQENKLSNNDNKRVDIWWAGGASSHLSLLLSYLLQRNEDWEDCELRLLCVPIQNKPVDVDNLNQHLDEIRIPAKIKRVSALNHDSLIAESADANMIFLPFRLRQDQFLTVNGEPLEQLLSGLPLTALTLANHDFELDTEPEKGIAAESAEKLDALDDIRDLYDYFQQQLDQLQREKEDLLSENSENATVKLAKLEVQLERISRLKAKVKAKLLRAEKQADGLQN